MEQMPTTGHETWTRVALEKLTKLCSPNRQPLTRSTCSLHTRWIGAGCSTIVRRIPVFNTQGG
jgi:hypothetical protein